MGQTPQRWVGHSRLVLAVLCMTILLDALDLSITQVALPSVGADMRMPLTLLPWVANAYVLTYGGLLLLGGRLCDLCGRRRVFLAGLGLFGGMSLLAGLINQPVFLIGCRALQGVGAALTVPAAVAILAATFPQGEQRNRALGVFAAFAGTGFSVGLVAGGALTATLGWPWIFLIKVPVVVAVMVAGLAVVPSDSAPDSRRPLDLPGAATSTAGLLLLALTVTLVASPDPRWPVVIAAGVLAAALLIGFSVQERRARDPLLPARLLTNRSHVIADLGSLTVLAAPFGFAYLVSSYLQGVAGYGPMRTGLAVLPGAVLSAVVSRVVTP